MTSSSWTGDADARPARSAWTAMLRGLRGRCPNCGQGRMFRAFLKVADNCPACGEELHHHRADDAPAYFVIAIVGHIVMPLTLVMEMSYQWSYAVHLSVWPALTLVLCLGLLTPVKGALVGMQWALRMHGFGTPDALEPAR